MDPPMETRLDSERTHPPPLLFLVEGQHDIEFLRRLSARLSLETNLPDLADLEQAGRLVFIPVGGGNLMSWADRFAPLASAEIHLYDKEILPETNLRRLAIARVNSRPSCRAFLTSKRSLENYLHPKAIVEAGGPSLEFGDEDSVAELVGRSKLLGTGKSWNQLSRRSRYRCLNRIKWWLNTVAVECMSLERLEEGDHGGDVLCWLQEISHLLKTATGEAMVSPVAAQISLMDPSLRNQ